MSKLQIDLHPDGEDGELISTDGIAEISSGCIETLRRLGKLAATVEVIKVTFKRFGSAEPGPDFTVHFRDPLGSPGSHGVDYRFMGPEGRNRGRGNPHPTAEDIAARLVYELERLIPEHLKSCEAKLDSARARLRILTRKSE